MINGYQSKLLDIYSKIREEENNLLKERKNTIKKYHPEILEIDENIKKLSLKLSLDILKGKSEDTIKEYKEKITDLRIEKCENIENILYSNSLTQLYVNNCNRFDIKNIKDIKLKILGLEYLEINNFYLLEEMKTLEKLELKEIDLRNINFVNLKHLKKIVLNGSIVNNKEETIKYLKNSGVEVEFLEKNLPIG